MRNDPDSFSGASASAATLPSGRRPPPETGLEGELVSVPVESGGAEIVEPGVKQRAHDGSAEAVGTVRHWYSPT